MEEWLVHSLRSMIAPFRARAGRLGGESPSQAAAQYPSSPVGGRIPCGYALRRSLTFCRRPALCAAALNPAAVCPIWNGA
ncbi:MAG: hypothetical protein OSJ43_00165 [Oscillospiraceae bacterium]|nr:hypothetical protein [Oscillospiraceae bacterium]